MASLDDYRDENDDPGEVYYLRLHLLVVKHATYVLQCKFDQLIPPNQLQTELNSQKNMDRLRYALNKNILNSRQKAMLYPTSGPPTSQDFDISLLMYLLRNICGLDTKSAWWKCEDNSKIPKHKTDVVADIVRIRNLRNKLQHKPSASLEENEFESEWNVAEEVMIRLTSQCGIDDFKHKIDDVKFSKLVSEELRSIRANTAIFLEEHQDIEFYVETNTRLVVLCGHNHIWNIENQMRMRDEFVSGDHRRWANQRNYPPYWI